MLKFKEQITTALLDITPIYNLKVGLFNYMNVDF